MGTITWLHLWLARNLTSTDAEKRHWAEEQARGDELLFVLSLPGSRTGPIISTTTTSTTTTTTTYQAVGLLGPSTSASTEEMTTLPWPGSKAPDDEDDVH